MAQEFIGMEIAVIVVSASIVLSGIMIGVGRGLGYKKVEHFGVVELIQSVINAAIIGSFAAIISLVSTISSDLVEDGEGSVVTHLISLLNDVSSGLFSLFQEAVKATELVSFYQTLSLDFGSFSISPFSGLMPTLGTIALQVLALQLVMFLIELNIQVLHFIEQNALALIFPLGLILRSFFATRKLGGFLIALSLGLFILYPSFIMIFPTPLEDVNQTLTTFEQFNNNSFYSTMPVVDMNDNHAIAGKIDIMSGRCHQNVSENSSCQQVLEDFGMTDINESEVDFSGELTLMSSGLTTAISKSALYSVVAPIFSLIITIVFVREVSSVVGGEITLGIFSSL